MKGQRAMLAPVGIMLWVSLTGCSTPTEETADIRPKAATTAASATPTPLPTAYVKELPTWVAGPGEVQPRLKRAVSTAIELAGRWDDREGSVKHVRARLREAGVQGHAVDQMAGALAGDAASARAQVVYPQYGGLTATRASVMVVTRQVRYATDGAADTKELTLDVRLLKRASGWVVVDVAEQRDGAASPISAMARRVLAEPSIRLPDAARDDIRKGRVDDSVLGVLARIAAKHTVDVSVLVSGHPREVFGTDRTSNHTRGRGVDIWRIDGRLVVDPDTPQSLLSSAMKEGALAGATEVGGPFDLNGRNKPGFFTNTLHADHLHFGVSPQRPPARW